MRFLLAAVVLVALTATSCGQSPAPEADDTPTATTTTEAPDPGEVSRAEMGKKWPLTVDQGRLEGIGTPGDCAVVFYAADGREYAVNGTAKDKLPDVQPIDAIWAKAGGGLRKDMGPLLNRGLKLCK